MLWIQYGTLGKPFLPILKEVVARTASLIAPYPVGACYNGTNGVGLVFHNGVLDLSRDEAGSDANSLSDQLSDLADLLNPGNLQSLEQSVECYPRESSAGHRQEISGSTEAGYSTPGKTSTSTTAGTSSESARQPNPGMSSNTSSQSSRASDGFPNQAPSGNEPGPGQRGSGENPAGAPNALTANSPKEYTDEEQYQMFVGVVKMAPTIEQSLSTAFELQISPSRLSKPVVCRIALSKVVFGASRPKNLEESGDTLDHYFVIKEVWIIVTPDGGQPSPPTDTGPRLHDLVYSITDTNTRQATISLQSSTTPFTGSASYTNQRQIAHPTYVIEATLGDSKNGTEQAYEWRWIPTTKTKTHLQFTTTNPPTHRVTYNILQNAETPKAYNVKAKVIYEKKTLLPMPLFNLSPRAWVFKGVQVKHFSMELETTIGTDEDFSKFPAPDKDGCYLEMEIDGTKKPFDWDVTSSRVMGTPAAMLGLKQNK